ncbi:MAG: hypothetical protein KGL39_36810 [Patescibacteria group bacterium]|nr:hypothetical protein [Patescibacteria group bacterium]
MTTDGQGQGFHCADCGRPVLYVVEGKRKVWRREDLEGERGILRCFRCAAKARKDR